ncbi:MAG: LysR family transcriptional regulator [Anaerolineae bacterium]|nr:LysR family transcriptional regulator [Anaerolineae bacterium]
MEFYQLRGFLAVAQTQSFTQAADQLFLTQPALSLQIKALEEELGQPLFERSGRRVLLTPAGRLLQERAEQIVALANQARSELQATQELQSGSLRLGATESLCLYILPPVIQFFHEKFPGIELQFINRHSAELVTLVAEGRIDFGLITLPILDPRLESDTLFYREDVAICAPTSPLLAESTVTLEALAAQPLLLLEKSSSSRVLLDQLLARQRVIPAQLLELGSIEIIKRFVALDLGVSIVPEYTIEAELKTGSLRAIRLNWLPTRTVGIVRRRKSFLSPAGQLFLKLLRNHVPQAWLSPLG